MRNEKEHIELNQQKWDSWAKSFDSLQCIEEGRRDLHFGCNY
jgi:hypothetical protein